MPTVFLVHNDGRRDISPALQFGNVVAMFDGQVPDAVAPGLHGPVWEAIDRCLDTHGCTEQDYLIPLGDPVKIAMATLRMAQRTGGVVNLLKWSNVYHRYTPVRITIPAWEERRAPWTKR